MKIRLTRGVDLEGSQNCLGSDHSVGPVVVTHGTDIVAGRSRVRLFFMIEPKARRSGVFLCYQFEQSIVVNYQETVKPLTDS